MNHRDHAHDGARTLHLAIGTGPQDGATVAALRLAARAVERGDHVTVYAYGEGVRVAADDTPTGQLADALLRAGLHGGQVRWVVDRDAARATCSTTRQVPGVFEGDGGDLWRFVRDADVVLGVSR